MFLPAHPAADTEKHAATSLNSDKSDSRRVTVLNPDKDDLDFDRPIVSELWGKGGFVARFVAAFLVVSQLFVFALAGGLLYYAFYHREHTCDQPLQLFFALLGACFVFHGVLLCLQLSCRVSQNRVACLMAASAVPAASEVVVLVLGTVWTSKADKCPTQLVQHAKKFLVIVWSLFLFGVLMRLYTCLSGGSRKRRGGDE